MDKVIRREIILDHYQHPKNKGLKDDNTYIKVRTNNTSCIDDLEIMLKVENGRIKDICFDGEACAISTSAASIMITSFIGKTKEEASILLQEYESMIDEKEYNEDLLGELNVYEDIYKQPNRKKCALLPFRAIHEILEQEELWKKE